MDDAQTSGPASAVEHMLNDWRERVRQVLERGDDDTLFLLIGALQRGESWEQYMDAEDTPADHRRFLEVLAAESCLHELLRRLEVAALE